MDACDHGCICLLREPDPRLAVISHVGNLQGQRGLDPAVNPVNVAGHSTRSPRTCISITRRLHRRSVPNRRGARLRFQLLDLGRLSASEAARQWPTTTNDRHSRNAVSRSWRAPKTSDQPKANSPRVPARPGARRSKPVRSNRLGRADHRRPGKMQVCLGQPVRKARPPGLLPSRCRGSSRRRPRQDCPVSRVGPGPGWSAGRPQSAWPAHGPWSRPGRRRPP